MNSGDEILSFMDLLDLDEDVIDSRLESIMIKNTYTNKHLNNALHLLKYKHLINLQEGTDCENDCECDFVAKLLNNMHEENIDIICKITNVILLLNPSKIVSKSEHILQQILLSIDLLESPRIDDGFEDFKSSIILLNLKLCNSILDAVIQCNEKISLPFLEVPLENILTSPVEKLKILFLTNTVPKLFEGVIGYNILDRIWNYLKQLNGDNRDQVLKVLSCLSEYYLPIADAKGTIKFESKVIIEYEFWNFLLFGMMSNDPSIRKISVYLIKRGIDCLIALKRDINVKHENEPLFYWEHNNEMKLKHTWDNFFILIDSLEEKQSNIVLPSLQLFDSLDGIQSCWINCAYNIGLKHDNTQVRLKCIDYRVNTKLTSEAEAIILLDALNDINLYDQNEECELMEARLKKTLTKDAVVHILRSVPSIKWSPVPLYHLSKVLASMNLEKHLTAKDVKDLSQIIIDLLTVPCNNIAIRKAIHVNISHFIVNHCKDLKWHNLINIYSFFNVKAGPDGTENPFVAIVEQNLNLKDEEKVEFYKCITESYMNIDFGLLYIDNHNEDIALFANEVTEKLKKIQNMINRQYADKIECLKDVIILTDLFSKTYAKNTRAQETLNLIISREYKTIVQYIINLLSDDLDTVAIEEIALLFKGFSSMSNALNNNEAKDILLQLYKSAVLLLKDINTDLHRRVTGVFILNSLVNNVVLKKYYMHEMLNMNQILEVISGIEFKTTQNIDDSGRLRNVFYEKACEIIHSALKEKDRNKQDNINALITFIEIVIECGGYGCLKWILKIMNDVLPQVLNHEETKLNIVQFINRMWKEIEELKSNNQYNPCIEQFVELITQDALLRNPMYNNIVIIYCNRIIEYGPLKNSPIYYLAKKLSGKDFTEDYGQIICALCEILLYSPVPRKDQRITENVEVEILQDHKYAIFNKQIDIYFNYQIKYFAVLTLSKIKHPEILEIIVTFLINNIEERFKNKQRYHGNSQLHRSLLTGMQHLLVIALLNVEIVQTEKVFSWTVEFLGRLPHQPSVRICLEWYMALYCYVKAVNLNDEFMQMLKSSNIPVTSQFFILFWILKHRILNGTHQNMEFEYVMDTLLSHTMGQMFNVRLNAQYLATKLYKMNETNAGKYTYIIGVIQKTFLESAQDKNFIKLKEEIFFNDFDVIQHLTPAFVYYFLPRYCEIGDNENLNEIYIKNILNEINDAIKVKDSGKDFKKEWLSQHTFDDNIFRYNLKTNTEESKVPNNGDTFGTIQKKYIPWKNMIDIDVYESVKKRESSSQLIVVASLIDKLPNLGGMARTSEVFGVKTYVVNSLRHLQEKQFQGLSVSAERWVNIEEVRPGQALKDYLMAMKTEGYTLVAAEQTSTSCSLQKYEFPKKTLLLLGHEKEGIPCNLLPIMDQCVEIPQQGFVRSLNVHVTASIFIWEYVRQNLL